MSSEFLNVLASGVFAPKPKPQQWCSESGIKFHLEKLESRATGLNFFVALCGFSGDFFHERFDGQTFLQCADCLEVASRPTGIAPVTDRVAVGDDSGGASSVCAPVESSQSECLPYQALNTGAGVQSTATDCTPEVSPWYFSCVRRGIDGFIADVDRVVDRETAEYQGVSE